MWIYTALCREHTSEALTCMARILKGSHSFTFIRRGHLLTEWTMPAFSFPAITFKNFPATQHHHPLTSMTLHCFVTEVTGVNNLAKLLSIAQRPDKSSSLPTALPTTMLRIRKQHENWNHILAWNMSQSILKKLQNDNALNSVQFFSGSLCSYIRRVTQIVFWL